VRSPRDLLDAETFAGLSRALGDRLPYRGAVIAAKARVERSLLFVGSFGSVEVGRDGWLFFRGSFGQTLGDEETMEHALVRLTAFLEQARGSRAELRVVVAPDKHTIYPEMLSERAQRDVARFAPARDRLHAYFGSGRDPRLIDLWSVYRRERARNSEPLYLADNTHFSATGALWMTREIVDSLQPGIWVAEDASTDSEQLLPSDLTRMAGLREDPTRVALLEVVRPGVRLVRRELPGGGDSWSDPVHFVSSTSGRPLIGGRTLIVHDSFIGTFLRPPLRQFFEDVLFLHHMHVTPAQLERGLRHYDQIVFQVVERDTQSVFSRVLRPPGRRSD
ncbi:MAG: alginate O-acetyltransferase AlgX-related protein, partial [Myxococcota bacterium]